MHLLISVNSFRRMPTCRRFKTGSFVLRAVQRITRTLRYSFITMVSTLRPIDTSIVLISDPYIEELDDFKRHNSVIFISSWYFRMRLSFQIKNILICMRV